MSWLYVLSVFLHVLAATFWIGGMLFLAGVVMPALRRDPGRLSILERLGRYFEYVGMGALAILLLTGLMSLTFRGVVLPGQLWTSPVGRMGL
ncbi:MAG: DUF4149 domain-containing protein, partial [Candidatus Kapabacteria bacterium]|nr:DUF4149 domain-containing protein [Candidatus Kapabacteria bacterium]MDW7996733.1 DUF4149 domain-containing protein [Bacteroidota bacterium]